MSKKKPPEVIEDGDLDDASGGLGMLLPAVQKVQDTTAGTGDTVLIKELDASSPKLSRG